MSPLYLGFICKDVSSRAQARFLPALANGSNKQRQGVIDGASQDLITCLCECALNILNGNVSLKPAERTKLKKTQATPENANRQKDEPAEEEENFETKGGFSWCFADAGFERSGWATVQVNVMEHGKKMVLIPQEILARMQASRRLEQTPITRVVHGLDTDMRQLIGQTGSVGRRKNQAVPTDSSEIIISR